MRFKKCLLLAVAFALTACVNNPSPKKDDNFTITWKNYDNSILFVSENVKKDTLPEYGGETPIKPNSESMSYTFTNWDPEVVPATMDATYVAQFSEERLRFDITFKNYDGKILKSYNLPYGEIPVYNGVDPTRESDEYYNYEFNGWSSEIVKVTCSITYTATYKAIPNGITPNIYNVNDYYDGYYSDIVSWQNGEDLKNQLHNIIRKEYTPLKYEGNWGSNIDADHIQDNFFNVDAVYTNNDIQSSNTNKGWQREHAFPASLMCGKVTSEAIKTLGRATDFHNLFASASSGNSSRGNKNYGYANPYLDTFKNDYSQSNGLDGYKYDNTIFEPGDIDKGRLSRAIFYMCTMYKDAESGYKGLSLSDEPVKYQTGSNCEYSIGNVNTLLAWSKLPVDRLEMQHNTSVQTHKIDGVAQGNRNPFVDYPGLVDYAFGDKQNESGTMNTIKPSALELDANSNEHRYYTIKDAKTVYDAGETYSNNGISIIDVKKDFSFISYTGDITSSLDGYTFSKQDSSKGKDAIITIGEETIKYHIDVEQSGSLSYSHIISKDGISNTAIGIPQTLNWSGISWTLTVQGDSGYTITNDNANGGGIKMGASTKKISSVILESKEEYTVDYIVVKAKAGNKNSSFKLNYYVGDIHVLDNFTISSTETYVEYGDCFTSHKGKIKLIFTGENALHWQSIAMNILD